MGKAQDHFTSAAECRFAVRWMAPSIIPAATSFYANPAVGLTLTSLTSLVTGIFALGAVLEGRAGNKALREEVPPQQQKIEMTKPEAIALSPL